MSMGSAGVFYVYVDVTYMLAIFKSPSFLSSDIECHCLECDFLRAIARRGFQCQITRNQSVTVHHPY